MATEDQITPALGAPLILPQAVPKEVEGQVSPSQDATFTLPGETPPPKDLGFWDTTKDVGKSFGAGALRGTAGLADLPGDLTQLVSAGSKYLTGYETPKFDTQYREGMANLSGGFSERKPETTLGRYAGTVGEFVPGVIGAGITGGGSLGAQALRAGTNVLKQAVLPGVASEALGQYVEKSDKPWLEPYARIAGAILGGVGVNGLESATRRLISPGGGASPARLAAADTLEKAGVKVTAGQKTGSPSILAAEGDTAIGQSLYGAAPDSPQMQAFTAATMQKLGSNSGLATEDALKEAQREIVGRMQNAVAGVDVMPTYPLMSSLSDAKKGYFANTNATVRPPIIEDIINEVQHAARTGQPIPATTMAAWRSNLGKHLYSKDNFVAEAAYDVRSALDDAIENSMTAAGQPERMAAWREARDQYRNYLAVEAAIKPDKPHGILGIITPQDLISSVKKQDRRGLVTGRRGEIGDLAKSGVLVAKPLPAPRGNQTLRKFAPFAEFASGIGSGLSALPLASYLGFGPVASAVTAGVAAGVPIVDAARRAIMRQAMQPTVQKYLGNQLVNPEISSSAIIPALAGAATSLNVDNRQNRKRGGRVSSHDMAADQLVRAAERAKKGWSAETEPLLNQSDDAIAHALEVANRSI